MIRPSYALKLARTKVHSKRAVLVTSTVVSSLLFAALICGIIVFSGVEKSAVTFVQKANNNKYLVQVNPVIPNNVTSYSLPLSIDDIHRIKLLEKSYYEGIKEDYKKNNITYDSTIEVPALTPSAFLPSTLPEEQRVQINYASPVIKLDQSNRMQAYVKTAKNTITDLKNTGAKYNADGYYEITPSGLSEIPNLKLISKNKENFDDSQVKSGDFTLYGYFINAIHNGSYQFEDDALLQRYILHTDSTTLKGVPVVVSSKEAVALFGSNMGITQEPNDVREREVWLKTVQSKLNGLTYQSCYRNSADMAMIEKIQRDYADIVNNKGNKDYQKPSLIYALPNKPCGGVAIQSDTRAAEEKKAEDTATANLKKLGTYTEPVRRLITFQIVGIIDAKPYSKYTDGVQNYLQNLLSTDNLTSSAIIPRQMYAKLPESLKFDDLTEGNEDGGFSAMKSAGLSTYIVSFSSIDNATLFMDRETCPGEDTNCTRLYASEAFGSNYRILNEIGKLFRRIMVYVAPVVFALAAVIIWFTMARVMADNRKETAVYRAMGAKRRDIAAIYLVYCLNIAIRIAALSGLAGVAVAWIINKLYGDFFTSIAVSSFGTITNQTTFSLFDLTSPLIMMTIITIITICYMAIMQPLIRNVMRPPIDDMRSE